MTRSKTETPPDHAQPSHKVLVVISDLLRIGVITSLSVIVLGTVVSFVRHPDYLSSRQALQHLTHAGAAFPHTRRRAYCTSRRRSTSSGADSTARRSPVMCSPYADRPS